MISVVVRLVGVAEWVWSIDCYYQEQLSDLCMSDIEGVWQGVESQLDLRLKTIEELNKQLNNLEDERSQQV